MYESPTTHLLDSALDSSLQTEPLELTSDEFVAAHEGLSCLLPVGGQGTSVRLLRVKLARIPLWLVVLYKRRSHMQYSTDQTCSK